jgi:hypothetical protein
MKRQRLIHKVFAIVALISMVLAPVQPVLAASAIQPQAAEALPVIDDTVTVPSLVKEIKKTD